jgi:hypothetical protein
MLFPETTQHHSSLEQLPQVHEEVSEDLNNFIDRFPPSMSGTTSGLNFTPIKDPLDFTPITNNQPANFATQ